MQVRTGVCVLKTLRARCTGVKATWSLVFVSDDMGIDRDKSENRVLGPQAVSLRVSRGSEGGR